MRGELYFEDSDLSSLCRSSAYNADQLAVIDGLRRTCVCPRITRLGPTRLRGGEGRPLQRRSPRGLPGFIAVISTVWQLAEGTGPSVTAHWGLNVLEYDESQRSRGRCLKSIYHSPPFKPSNYLYCDGRLVMSPWRVGSGASPFPNIYHLIPLPKLEYVERPTGSPVCCFSSVPAW